MSDYTPKTYSEGGEFAYTDANHLEQGLAAHAHPQSEVTGLVVALAAKVAKGDLFVNVRDSGAKGDGTTDDTAAVQSAINSLPSGGCVYFPPGTYLCSTLTVYGATQILGAGRRVSTLKLKAGTNGALIQTPNDGIQRYGLSMAQLSLDGQASLQTANLTALINVRAMNESSFSELQILNPRGPAIEFGQATAGMYCTVPMLNRIFVRGDPAYSMGHGLFFNSGSSDAVVSQVDIGYFGAGGGLSFSGHSGAVVSNSNAWQCRYGVQLYQSNRMRLLGVLSDYAKLHGFIAQQSSDLQFDGCQAREYSVTTLSASDGFRLEGNATGPVAATDLTLMGCRAMSTRGRVGVALQNDLSHVRVVGGSLNGQNVATTVVGTNVTDYRFLAVAGVADVAV